MKLEASLSDVLPAILVGSWKICVYLSELIFRIRLYALDMTAPHPHNYFSKPDSVLHFYRLFIFHFSENPSPDPRNAFKKLV